MSNKIKELKDMMCELMVVQAVKPKVCEFCKSTDLKTDECPTLFEDIRDVNAIGGWASKRAQVPPRQGQHQFGLANNDSV